MPFPIAPTSHQACQDLGDLAGETSLSSLLDSVLLQVLLLRFTNEGRRPAAVPTLSSAPLSLPCPSLAGLRPWPPVGTYRLGLRVDEIDPTAVVWALADSSKGRAINHLPLSSSAGPKTLWMPLFPGPCNFNLNGSNTEGAEASNRCKGTLGMYSAEVEHEDTEGHWRSSHDYHHGEVDVED